MRIEEVISGYFKLDGGAMFGVVPKTLWNKLNPADENNLCVWAMRSLLIIHQEKRILVDTGIGHKQGVKFQKMFGVHGPSALSSLRDHMITGEEITDVFLTHLHFDHVGGAISTIDGALTPTFPNATYWSNQIHWDWAVKSNPREEASFLEENFLPLREKGMMQFIDVQNDDIEWLPGVQVRFLYGHTQAMMMLILDPPEGPRLFYPTDLIPSRWHVRMPYILSYDLQPLETMKEKKRLLDECIDQEGLLVFEHDPSLSVAKPYINERGRYQVRAAKYFTAT